MLTETTTNVINSTYATIRPFNSSMCLDRQRPFYLFRLRGVTGSNPPLGSSDDGRYFVSSGSVIFSRDRPMKKTDITVSMIQIPGGMTHHGANSNPPVE